MSLLRDFREFAMKGSVVDLAVGVIIGNAFGRIVSALVDKVLMPPVGYLIGGVDFSKLRLVLSLPGATGDKEVAIYYGEFIQASVNFLIIAFCMFMVIRIMTRLKLAGSSAPPPENILLLREIRDLLKQK
jgi:large conductance mechanosensitive channel